VWCDAYPKYKLAYEKIFNDWQAGKLTKYGEVKDYVNAEDNVLPGILRRLTELGLIVRVKVGYYTIDSGDQSL